MKRNDFKQIKRCVIKVGSAMLTGEQGLNQQALDRCVDQIAEIRRLGIEVILVSSGAVADGMMRLGWKTRPRALYELQAAAAVGQMGLVQAYESRFQKHKMHTAQILLTHDDLSNRKRYLNARSTLRTLLELGVIPVINENDTVSFDEMRFGDNDTLAALVANLIEAELLVILTDQQGLFDQDPRNNADANLISEAVAGDESLEKLAGSTPGSLGRGGMLSKVKAATLAARSGTSTVIASGDTPQVLNQIFNGEQIGTLLSASQVLMAARKRWLAGHLQVSGKLVVDAGAAKVLKGSGRSLLSVGVTAVEGEFNRGELVSCVDQDGCEIARGLVNYNAEESVKIIGQASDRIEAILGYVDEPELINRDNLVIV